MAIVAVSPAGDVIEGELLDDDCGEFREALEALRTSNVKVPTVDVSRVSAISSMPIGLLVTLCIRLLEEGRWFDLLASDKVWDVLGKVGLSGVFFKRPDPAAQTREVH